MHYNKFPTNGKERGRRRTGRITAAAALTLSLAGCSVASTPQGGPSSSAAPQPAASSPNTRVDYYYVAAGGAYKDSKFTGASATLTQAAPRVSGHAQSIAELFVVGNGDSIGLGWSVSPAYYGDDSPHLWLERFDNAKNSLCANALCGLVLAPGAHVAPGQTLSPSGQHVFGLSNDGKQGWGVYYDHRVVGHFPPGTAGTNIPHITALAVQGEVAIPETIPATSGCVQMGNGIPGTEQGAASISGLQLIAGTRRTSAPVSIQKVTNSNFYNGRQAADGTIFYGGSGAGCMPAGHLS